MAKNKIKKKPGPKNKGGRPPIMTDDTIKKLEEVFALGGSDSEACFYANISKQTLYNYQKEHPEFVDRKEALKEKPILEAKHGSIFLTIPWVKIIQKQTQANKGGLTDIYLNYGTYVKSFYTVMINPSSVRVAEMGSRFKRIHHRVEGNYTYPMIIRESIKNNGK